MKKKFRTITVKGVQYGWIVKNMGCTLEIFKDKKLIHTVNMNNVTPITIEIKPKFVRKTILNLL